MTNTKKSTGHRVPPYKRPFIVAIILIVLVAAVAGIIMLVVNLSQPQSSDDQPEAETSAPLGSQDEKVPSHQEEDTPNQRPTAYEGTDPNTLGELTGSLTLKNLSNNTLTVSAIIDQYLESDGVCELTLTGDGGYTQSVTVAAVADVTTSTCELFQVNVADFPSGHYQLKITLTGDGKTGEILDEVNL